MTHERQRHANERVGTGCGCVPELPVLSLGADTSGTAAPPPLLSHDELQKRLSDQSLRVVDVRPKADYEKGHIPAQSGLTSRPSSL